jgi:hypothetical protein
MRVTRRDSLGPIEVVRGDAVPTAGAIAARETPEGYLLIEGRINGCGVYRYEDAHGDAWGELRLPEHVGAPATVDSWDGRVLTDDHPPAWLDAANTREYQRGTVTRPAFDAAAGFTFARILITDAELIGRVRAGKCELSCGYDCVLVQAPGHLDGQAYDYVQTDIRGNHVAIVDRARGGPMCALIFDAASSRGERPSMSKTTDTKAPKAGTGSAPPKRRDGTSIEIGGQLFEGLPEELVMAIEGMQAQLAEHESMMGDAKPEDRPMDSSEVSRLRSELDRSRGRLEVLEKLERERADAEKARELDSLRARAERVAGCKLDGADDLEVLRGAIKAVDKSANVDGLSRDRLLGRFEALEQTGHRDQALSILTIVRSGEADRGDSLSKAGERRRAKIEEMKKGA